MSARRKTWAIRGAVAGVAVIVISALALADAPALDRATAGKRAFGDVARVLQSPRCRNCHPAGEAPLQTDPGRPHAMNISRATVAAGTPCSTCHQDRNSEAVGVAGGPPGAPRWGLPPAETPMVFEGKTVTALCEQLQDPARNGHRTLEMLLEQGLPTVFARHQRWGEGVRAAVRAWGLPTQCADERLHSPVLTGVITPQGVDADALRKLIHERFDLSLGTGLGRVKGRMFRIGHLGDCNDLTLMATLAGVEMGLRLAEVPIAASGVQAAMAHFSAVPQPQASATQGPG